MATADLLLELMFSWIDQRERCARQLKKLANELESLRKKCNASELFGNSASVVGAACLLGAGAATLFTGGAAAPFLGVSGAACTGVGVTVSVITKLIEHLLSSSTMKEAEKIEKKSNNIAQRIQKQFDQLKAEIKKVNPSADLDEVDRHVMTELLGAMTRRSGLKIKIDFSKLRDMSQRSSHQYMNMQLNQPSINTMPILLGALGFACILTFFACKPSGKGSKPLIAEGTKRLIKQMSTRVKTAFKRGTKRLIKQMSTTGVKTAFKGGAMMVGGAVGLAFALPEAVDSWKEMIKKNHVTKASQSLRDTADTILKMSRKLREEFDNMRKMLEEMAEQQEQERIRKAEQQEQERIRKAKQQQERIKMARCQQEQQQERIRKARRQKILFSLVVFLSFSLVLIYYNIKSSNSAQKQRETQETCLETQISKYQSHMTKKCFLCKQTGSEQQGRDDQGDEERDQEDEKRDQEDEERDQEDEERDQEDEERDHEDGFPNITTFEYVATVLQHDTWNEPIVFINVYRTGSLTRGDLEAFLKEFQSLLDHYRNNNYNNIVVAGDFNIHVDAVKSIPSRFLEFLRNNNLVQHVNKPTHRGNHTLDLVMSRNVDISDLSVQNDRISDHDTVSFTVSDQEGKAVKVGLLNCRSMNNKPEKIRDLIERNNLDILLLTETWTKDTTADKVLRNASPEGFSFCYESRTGRRGGGVAILFRKELSKQTSDQDESPKRFKANEE